MTQSAPAHVRYRTDLVDATSRRTAGVTEEHYNRAMRITAGEEYGIIAQHYRQRGDGET